MKIVLMLVTLLLVGISSAASDEEILQFASGVLAGSIFTDSSDASINVNTLVITDRLSEYSDDDVGMLGFDLYNLIGAAEKVIKQYPRRFVAVEVKLYDPSGNVVVGTAGVRVR